ncbi:unnamed protein product [Leptosia nina]|uniref:Uncharacterized protein n=1 Tax=Leptosia nina TaxID=320188 RepID=A0AAV1JNV6_9NEOP
MKNHMNQNFRARFSSLNTQPNSEDFILSCSSSENECENVIPRKHLYTKRKRTPSKKLNNVSNLDITITDVSQDQLKVKKSPILLPKMLKENRMPDCKNGEVTSPILVPKSMPSRSKSPILPVKSKQSSPSVCKKLFQPAAVSKKRCLSPILNTNKRKSFIEIKSEQLDTSDENQNLIQINMEPQTNNTKLVEKVKSYFEGNFSSESPSQNSISEYDSPKSNSRTSEEIDIVDASQGLPPPMKQEQFSTTDDITATSKKVKYKKDGLAFRLNILLRKQKANLSLWQHERFLADNSSFVMPKEVYTAYRIKKVDLKFGCVLLLAVDSKDDLFLILINSQHIDLLPFVIARKYGCCKSSLESVDNRLDFTLFCGTCYRLLQMCVNEWPISRL